MSEAAASAAEFTTSPTSTSVTISIDEDGDQAAQRARAMSQSQRRRRKKRPKPSFNSMALAGETLASRGEYQRAIPFYEKALEFGNENDSALATVHSQLGNCLMASQQYEPAIVQHKYDLFLSKRAKNKSDMARACGNLAMAYKATSQREKAVEMFQRQLKFATSLNDAAMQARALDNLGQIYHSLGNDCLLSGTMGKLTEPRDPAAFDTAVRLYRKNFGMQDHALDPKGLGRACGFLATSYEKMKEYPLAIRYHQQRLDIAQESGDQAAKSRSLNGLGNVYREQGQYDKAIEMYKQDLEIALAQADERSIAITYSNLGSAYQASGDYELAIEHHEKYIHYAAGTGNKSSLAWAHANLGAIYEFKKNFAKAASHYSAQVQLAKTMDDKVSETEAAMNLARVQEYQEQRIHVVDMDDSSLKRLARTAPKAVRKATAKGFNSLLGRSPHLKASSRRRPVSVEGLDWRSGRRAADSESESASGTQGSGDNSLEAGPVHLRPKKNAGNGSRLSRAFSMSLARRSFFGVKSSDSEQAPSDEDPQAEPQMRKGRLKSLSTTRHRLSSLFSSKKNRANISKVSPSMHRRGPASHEQEPSLAVTNIDVAAAAAAAAAGPTTQMPTSTPAASSSVVDVDALEVFSLPSAADVKRAAVATRRGQPPRTSPLSSNVTVAPPVEFDPKPLRVVPSRSRGPSPAPGTLPGEQPTLTKPQPTTPKIVVPKPNPSPLVPRRLTVRPSPLATPKASPAVERKRPPRSAKNVSLQANPFLMAADETPDNAAGYLEIGNDSPKLNHTAGASKTGSGSALLSPPKTSSTVAAALFDAIQQFDGDESHGTTSPSVVDPATVGEGHTMPPDQPASTANSTSSASLAVPVPAQFASVPPPTSFSSATASTPIPRSPVTSRQAWVSDSGGVYVAVYDYKGKRDEELSFSVGDVFTNVKQMDGPWFFGRHDHSGKEGSSPVAFVFVWVSIVLLIGTRVRALCGC
eukprot:m.54280 g.54280  ORF g.54280 m.54280 type:complete len:980 (+) comp11407_c0_seq2:340-3279(+)